MECCGGGRVIGGVNYEAQHSIGDFLGRESLGEQMKCHDESSLHMPVREVKSNVSSGFLIHLVFDQQQCFFNSFGHVSITKTFAEIAGFLTNKLLEYGGNFGAM